jgi:membrane-bound lytic murein transglycosylase
MDIMIHVKQALGISLATLMLPTAALAVAMLAGCASDKPKPVEAKAAAPAPKPVSLTLVKSELATSKAQIQTTTEALNKLQKSSPADAQANYNAFTEQYLKLKAQSEQVATRAEDLKTRASAYFTTWDKQASVDNPELRKGAVQQKAEARRTYDSIVNEMELTRIAFKPYMANLADVGSYLRGNVSPATLNSISELVAKTNAQGKEVDTHLAAILSGVDKITTGTGEAAPASGGAPAGGASAQ